MTHGLFPVHHASSGGNNAAACLYPAVHIIFYLQEAVDAILRNDLMKKPPRLLLDNQIRIQKPAAQNLSQDHPNRTFPRSGHTDQNDIIFRTHKHQPR